MDMKTRSSQTNSLATPVVLYCNANRVLQITTGVTEMNELITKIERLKTEFKIFKEEFSHLKL